MSVVYVQTDGGIIRLESVHTPDYIGRLDCVINPDKLPDLSLVTISGGKFIPFTDGQVKAKAVSDLEEAKTAKLAEIANARWEAETGGLTLPDGTTIKTDRESQALLTGAAFSATLDPETPIEWKGANGWVVLMPQEVLQIAGLVRRHVQGCFSRERALSAQVEAIAQDVGLEPEERIKAIQAVEW